MEFLIEQMKARARSTKELKADEMGGKNPNFGIFERMNNVRSAVKEVVV